MDNAPEKIKRQLPPYITWKQFIIGTLVLLAVCRLSGDIAALIWRLSVPDLTGVWETSYYVGGPVISFERDGLPETGRFKGTATLPAGSFYANHSYKNSATFVAEWDGRVFHLRRSYIEVDEDPILTGCLRDLILTPHERGYLKVNLDNTGDSCYDLYFYIWKRAGTKLDWKWYLE